MGSSLSRDIPQLTVSKLRTKRSFYGPLSAILFAVLTFLAGGLFATKCPKGHYLFEQPANVQKCDKCTCAEKDSCGKVSCGPCK